MPLFIFLIYISYEYLHELLAPVESGIFLFVGFLFILDFGPYSAWYAHRHKHTKENVQIALLRHTIASSVKCVFSQHGHSVFRRADIARCVFKVL